MHTFTSTQVKKFSKMKLIVENEIVVKQIFSFVEWSERILEYVAKYFTAKQ